MEGVGSVGSGWDDQGDYSSNDPSQVQAQIGKVERALEELLNAYRVYQKIHSAPQRDEFEKQIAHFSDVCADAIGSLRSLLNNNGTSSSQNIENAIGWISSLSDESQRYNSNLVSYKQLRHVQYGSHLQDLMSALLQGVDAWKKGAGGIGSPPSSMPPDVWQDVMQYEKRLNQAMDSFNSLLKEYEKGDLKPGTASFSQWLQKFNAALSDVHNALLDMGGNLAQLSVSSYPSLSKFFSQAESLDQAFHSISFAPPPSMDQIKAYQSKMDQGAGSILDKMNQFIQNNVYPET